MRHFRRPKPFLQAVFKVPTETTSCPAILLGYLSKVVSQLMGALVSFWLNLARSRRMATDTPARTDISLLSTARQAVNFAMLGFYVPKNMILSERFGSAAQTLDRGPAP